MATITLKAVPKDLHGILKSEASANFRTLPEEVMARLQRSLDSEMITRRDQRWVDEALASGPESPLTVAEMDKIRDRVFGRRK